LGIDFYLSEMAVSAFHGGGITLERVLGPDLEDIRRFVHVSEFGQHLPAFERLRSRCVESPLWSESAAARRWLGWKGSRWVSRQPGILRQHGRRSVRLLLRQEPAASGGRRFRGLVCPQGAASLHTLEHLKARADVRYITWIMDDHLGRRRGDCWHYDRKKDKKKKN